MRIGGPFWMRTNSSNPNWSLDFQFASAIYSTISAF